MDLQGLSGKLIQTAAFLGCRKPGLCKYHTNRNSAAERQKDGRVDPCRDVNFVL